LKGEIGCKDLPEPRGAEIVIPERECPGLVCFGEILDVNEVN
jgi:hypothetical protein